MSKNKLSKRELKFTVITDYKHRTPHLPTRQHRIKSKYSRKGKNKRDWIRESEEE